MSYYASTTYGRPDIHIKLFITKSAVNLLKSGDASRYAVAPGVLTIPILVITYSVN
jgi:hypothetical protein